MKQEIRIHAAGGRFDAFNGYPPATLATLAAWEKLVRAIVRDRFKAVHGVEARVPRALDLGLSFAVTSIVGGGSADGIVGFSFTDDSPYRDFYIAAGDDAAQVLAYLDEDARLLPDTCSMATRQQIVAVQDGLQEGETFAVQLPTNSVHCSRTLNAATLRRAIQIRGQVLPVQRQPEWRCGRIDGITRDPWTIGLKVQGSHRSTTISCPVQFWDDALAAFHDKALVRIQVSCTARDEGAVLDTLLSLSRVGGPDFETRLHELKSLRDDWVGLESGSVAPRMALLKRVRMAMWEVVTVYGEQCPHIFPTAEGAVEAQWRDHSGTRILRFGPTGSSVVPIYIDRISRRTLAGPTTRMVADALGWLQRVSAGEANDQ